MILFAKKLNDALHIVEPPVGWDKIANNELVKVTLKKQRFVPLHRKYCAIIRTAFYNQDRYKNYEVFRKFIEIEAGYYTPIYNPSTGEVYKIPQSIAFDKLDELEFRELYSSVCDYISANYGIEIE